MSFFDLRLLITFWCLQSFFLYILSMNYLFYFFIITIYTVTNWRMHYQKYVRNDPMDNNAVTHDYAITCDTVCPWLAAGLSTLSYSSGTLVSSSNKIDHHDLNEILLKVALKTITLTFTPWQCIGLNHCSSKHRSVRLQLCPPKIIGNVFSFFKFSS